MILKQLHDATLNRFEFDWVDGTLSFYLEVEASIVRLVATGVSSYTFDRKHPWGPSVSINEVKIDQVENQSKLSIEMQSGDLMVAWISGYELRG